MLVRYMGTKKWLAETIFNECQLRPSGAFVDAFSGMNSVGQTFYPTRNVWTNDIQFFSYLFAKTLFTAGPMRTPSDKLMDSIRKSFTTHLNSLVSKHSSLINEETNVYDLNPPTSIAVKEFESTCQALSTNTVSGHRQSNPTHTLFTNLYAGTYIGLRQAMELDSIRHAIEIHYGNKPYEDETGAIMLLALARSLDKCATTTGHFAQPLTPSNSNIKRFVSTRKLSIWGNWKASLSYAIPLGHSTWRANNIARNLNASDFIKHLIDENLRPSIIYLDPPYTRDQYSRYYHLYETLLLYDYPTISGNGRYRGDRFVSPFCLKTKAHKELLRLIKLCSETGADLILSYPTNGLIEQSDKHISDGLMTHYKSMKRIQFQSRTWSSLGARHGSPRTTASEVLYVTSGVK